jgi:hypothetical protein
MQAKVPPFRRLPSPEHRDHRVANWAEIQFPPALKAIRMDCDQFGQPLFLQVPGNQLGHLKHADLLLAGNMPVCRGEGNLDYQGAAELS